VSLIDTLKEKTRQAIYSYVYRNIEARSRNHCCHGNAVRMKNYESVYSCLRYAACKAHAPYYIFICSLSGSTIFFHISHKRHEFREKIIEHKMCVLIFSTTSVWNMSHSKNNSVRYNKYTGFHLKYPLFLSDFNESWILSTDFRKILKYQSSWKSVQWKPSCSMRTDR
jgi:hypothetical protein